MNKVLYLHGRPMAHPMHKVLAESLASDFYFVDKHMRWQDKNRSFIYRILSWFVNAFTYPIKIYQYILVDNLHIAPVIAKKMGLLGHRKIIVHLGSHTLYFMYTGKFSFLVNRLHKYALKNYDILFCEGKMEAELAKKILGDKTPKTYVTYLGVSSERYIKLKSITPLSNSRSILIIANGPTTFREYYKGLDLMIRAYAICFPSIIDLSLKVLGEWEGVIIEKLLKNLDSSIKDSISFEGTVSNIDDYLAKSSLCLHCTRGDAFPTSTLEAMAAGVVPLISEWTGTKEIISRVSPHLIVPLDEQEIAKKILWFFSLVPVEREALSIKCRTVVDSYTQARAVNHYQETFNKMHRDIILAN